MTAVSLTAMFIFISAGTASAQVSVTNKPPTPIGQPTSPPVPTDLPAKPAKGPIRFSALQEAFDFGSPTSQTILTGDWLQVAVATNAACRSVILDNTNMSGTRNDDGTYYGSLVFDLFDDNTLTASSVFGVKIKNLGSAKFNQGPYAVDLNEPQFAEYAYTGNKMITSSFFSFACRAIGPNADRLICAARLNADEKDRKKFPDGAKCADSGRGLMFAYKKQK